MEPLRWVHVPGFTAVFFRRTTVQVRNPGGLLDESRKVYPLVGGSLLQQAMEWSWESGARIKMAHLEYENTVEEWQGAQVCLFIFDELTHFTERMFFYMLSRNRSICGVKPYVLATCNPDADSWVAKLIEWWVDQETGFPIQERSGVLRYFARINDNLVWGDSRDEITEKCPNVESVDVKSITFIPGKLSDNPALTIINPSYRGNLMAMSRVERARLLDGNWKVRAAAGMYFQRGEAKVVDTAPADVVEWVRRWDLAATEPHETNKDPDWTCGVKLGRTKTGRFVVGDVQFFRVRSQTVRERIKKTAELDGRAIKIGIPEDPGQAGKEQAQSYVRELAGYTVWTDRETGDKVTRADPFASQWQKGNVDIVRGPWNDWYLALMEAFPTAGVHDDPVDASSGAFAKIAKGRSIFDNL